MPNEIMLMPDRIKNIVITQQAIMFRLKVK